MLGGEHDGQLVRYVNLVPSTLFSVDILYIRSSSRTTKEDRMGDIIPLSSKFNR
jgi:hypothetical protein